MDEWLSVCVRGKGCGSSLFVAVSLDVFSFYNILVRHLILDRTGISSHLGSNYIFSFSFLLISPPFSILPFVFPFLYVMQYNPMCSF